MFWVYEWVGLPTATHCSVSELYLKGLFGKVGALHSSLLEPSAKECCFSFPLSCLNFRQIKVMVISDSVTKLSQQHASFNFPFYLLKYKIISEIAVHCH